MVAPANPASGIARNYSPPFPNLQTYPLCGAMGLVPWAEVASFDMSAGPDGVTMGMTIMVYWQDLAVAIRKILGYTYVMKEVPGKLFRVLPWQNPKFAQLWAHSIAGVEGRRLEGFSLARPQNIKAEGTGDPTTVDIGPAADYNLALITIRFWRPPYAVLADNAIVNTINGVAVRCEWQRYTSRTWQIESQYLTGPGNYMSWCQADGSGSVNGSGQPTGASWDVPGSQQNLHETYGTVVSHAKISRRWYEIPEAAIYKPAQDSTPTGLPYNFFYTQTQAVNPITGFTYASGSPIPGCVNCTVGGDPWNGLAHNAGNLDTVASAQFLGMPMGTLRFESAEIIERPLQLPASLMQIPFLVGFQPASQVQYDVVFHFDYCDMPRGWSTDGTTQNPFRGHNIVPTAKNLQWYPICSQNAIKTPLNTAPGRCCTPYHYADFTDLFTPLTPILPTPDPPAP